MDDAYCPARFGVCDELTPRSPWHMVQRSASVAPRPTPPPDAGSSSVVGVMTTSDTFTAEVTGALAPSYHERGTPAALHIEFNRPLNRASSWAEGSQTKPTKIEKTRSRNVPPTLPTNHRLRRSGPFMVALPRTPAGHGPPASSSAGRSGSRSW